MTPVRLRTWLFLAFAFGGMLFGLAMFSDRISMRRTLRHLEWYEAFQVVTRVHGMIPHPLIQALQLVLGLACLALFIWLLSQARQRAPIDKRRP